MMWKWRWHRLQEAIAKGYKSQNGFWVNWFGFSTILCMILVLIGGGIGGGFGAAVGVALSFFGSGASGAFILYSAHKGIVAGGLPYGWVRTGEERWLEVERNEKAGWSKAEKQVRVENPRRGDSAWCTLVSGFRRGKVSKTKKLLLDSRDQPVNRISGEYFNFETQEIMKQLSSGSASEQRADKFLT